MTEATYPSPAGTHPVATLAVLNRIASAAVAFFGRYGDVTRLARQRGTGRQAAYRQADAVRQDLDPDRRRQGAPRLRQQLDRAQARGHDLQRRLGHAVVLDEARQAEFAAVD